MSLVDSKPRGETHLPHEILFASTNRGKFLEASAEAARVGIKLISPADICSRYGPIPDVVEDAGTYRGNSELKARAFYAWSGLPVLADDTGLEVLALGGAPGVYSARYAGEGLPFDRNIEKLFFEMQGKSDRTARFICTLCYFDGSGAPIFIEGDLGGEISAQQVGSGGFGYDPIFYLPDKGLMLAEAKGNGVQVETHRIRALREFFAQGGFI